MATPLAAPATRTLTHRPALPGDIGVLRELFSDAHVELAVLPPDTRHVLVDMQFRAERRRHLTRYPHAQDDILMLGERPVGRLLADRTGETIELVDLAITLGLRGLGFGTQALGTLLAEADAAHRTVQVTVWAGNATAMSILRNRGFVPHLIETGYATLHRLPA